MFDILRRFLGESLEIMVSIFDRVLVEVQYLYIPSFILWIYTLPSMMPLNRILSKQLLHIVIWLQIVHWKHHVLIIENLCYYIPLSIKLLLWKVPINSALIWSNQWKYLLFKPKMQKLNLFMVHTYMMCYFICLIV